MVCYDRRCRGKGRRIIVGLEGKSPLRNKTHQDFPLVTTKDSIFPVLRDGVDGLIGPHLLSVSVRL